LIRRNRTDPADLAYYVVFGPADTSLATLARVAGRRWIIEECFEAAKQETGLDEYEIRSWHGWHRHVTLSMLALAFLAAMRAQCAGQKGASARDFPAWCRSACRSSAASAPVFARHSAHPTAS
jgi:SRSO17 transposase